MSRQLGSVERAVALLEALAAAGGPLGTNELGRRTGINASTVSRVLATLLAAGYVEREPGAQRWQLGLRLVHLGNAALARLDLRELARPLLEQLVRETGETATLSLPAQGEGVTVDFAPSPHSVSSRAEIGRASVAHATAVGKLVLAHVPGALASLSEPLERYTPRTLTTLAEIEHAVGGGALGRCRRGRGRARAGAERHRRAGTGGRRPARRGAGPAGPGALRRRGAPRRGANAGPRRGITRRDRGPAALSSGS